MYIFFLISFSFFFTCFNVCAGKSYLLIFKIICVYGLYAFFPKLWWECSGRRDDLRCSELRFSLLANVLLFLYFPVAIARPDLPCFSVCKLLCTFYSVFFGQSLPFMCWFVVVCFPIPPFTLVVCLVSESCSP